MTPVTQIRGFMPFTAIVLLQAAVALGHSTVIYTAISRGYSGQHPLVLMALANALVILPMVLMVQLFWQLMLMIVPSVMQLI